MSIHDQLCPEGSLKKLRVIGPRHGNPANLHALGLIGPGLEGLKEILQLGGTAGILRSGSKHSLQLGLHKLLIIAVRLFHGFAGRTHEHSEIGSHPVLSPERPHLLWVVQVVAIELLGLLVRIGQQVEDGGALGQVKNEGDDYHKKK